MINGNADDFLEDVYNLQEIIHTYNGKKYFLQGYGGGMDESYTLEMQLWEPEQKIVWSYTGSSLLECREEYLKATLYDGKTFWEVEKDIEWVDE